MNMEKYRYLFIKAATLLMPVFFVMITCSAAATLPESGLLWKNISVMGKRMSVYCIFTDSRGIVWLGTNNGLFFYDGVTTHAVDESGKAMNQVYSITEKDGKLFLGTNYGLMTFSFQDNSIGYYTADSPKEIRCMLIDDDRIWLGSIYGMYTVDTGTKEIMDISEGLPHKSVYSILKDCRGILYAGTYDGLSRWDQAENVFREVPIPEHDCNSGNLFVNCLLETADRQKICIGTEGNMYIYSPETGTCHADTFMTGKNIKCLAQSDDGHILIGTDSGIFDMSNDNIRQYRHDSRQEQAISNNEIWCIHTDGSNIFAGHEMGFSAASNSSAIRVIKLSSITDSGEGNDIHSIYRDGRGTLWITGTNGIIRLKENGTARWYHPSGKTHSLSHNHIRIIKEDSDGNIWFGTDGGLNRYNAGSDDFDVFHIVDKDGKHSSNWVYAIEEDKERLLVGSYLGGLHSIAKSKLSGRGRVVVSDESTNTGSQVFKGHHLKLNNDLVNKVIKDHEGNIWILCFNDDFLTRILPDGKVDMFDIGALAGCQPATIDLDGEGRLWCAFKGGAIVFKPDNTHEIIRFPETGSDESVLAIAKVGDGMWISTVSNVWSIDGKSMEIKLLPIAQKSYKAIFSDPVTGKVYLGGNDEITEVDPRMMDGKTGNSIRMVLANVENDVFDMSELVPAKEGLEIPYGGNLTVAVSNLDYSPAAPQRYAYKLARSYTDSTAKWIIMPENSNTISLPEMKMGDCLLLIRPAGTPGPAYSLPLHVQAPWFLSWWAFSLYFMAVLSIIAYIIVYMHQRHMRLIREEDRRKSLENVERKLAFLSGISHDLKTPLSMIIGPASLLREKVRDNDVRKSLDTIYNNAVRLNSMIHRTLEINYLEDTGEKSLILSTFDAVDLCKSIFEAFKENHPQKKFIFHTSEPQLPIEADAVKFESIITNLFSNACKYSEDDATISCGICRIDRNIHIVVSDDGFGIDEIDQPLVFQRMFRSPSTSKMKEGTGIGLYLAKQYIELMKGKIELYSAKGQGTSFIITLPLSENAALRHHEESDVADIGCKKPKILIVEDNQQISDFIYDMLVNDYICLTAGNGRAGLSIATSFIPDLIISDELMPVMNGMEMIRRIKQDVRLTNIPIIMLTAKSDNVTENDSVKLGVDVFMPKPFEPSVLLGRIRHLMEVRQKLHESIRIEAITEVKPIEAESVPEKQLALISKIIEENISDPDLNVNVLCEKCGMPNKQLYRIIKKYIGVGPLDHIRNVRLQKAAMLLSQKRFTVSEICYMVGFKTPSYFAKCFQEKFGVKPSQYQSDDKIDI